MTKYYALYSSDSVSYIEFRDMSKYTRFRDLYDSAPVKKTFLDYFLSCCCVPNGKDFICA